MERRLAAILLTDMVGYSRLMGLDEGGTIARQKAHREEVIDPKISSHGGRIVKTTGDGLLVEFPSVVDAVQCAVEVQEAIARHDADIPDDRRIQYRIGINLGDIVIDGDDILGDGVNVAARLEGLAKPGGICISGTVHEQLAGKMDIAFADAGEQTVKNIPRPVRIWHWKTDQTERGWDKVHEPLQQPDKPSIAVLPFTNMSDDPEQEYFSDGIAEDIITGLSLFRNLFVIARNSTFTYKGKSIDVRQVAKELGVRYVLEGSVRKAGARVRITVQLIDATSGGHVWADRYDRELDDIFALQDEITERVVSAISPAIINAEMHLAMRKRPESLAAQDWYLRGLWHLQKFKKPDNAEAQSLFSRAIEIDPDFAQAHARLATSLWYDVWLTWSAEPEKSLQAAYETAKRAVVLDERDEWGHFALSLVCTFMHRYDVALAAARRAVELNPGNAYSHTALGIACQLSGVRNEEAILAFDTALRLSPADPLRFGWFGGQAIANYQLRRYEDATERAHQAIQFRYGYIFGRAVLTASLARLERDREAAAEFADIIRLKPDFSAASFAHYPWRDVDRDHLLDGLHLAGLPN